MGCQAMDMHKYDNSGPKELKSFKEIYALRDSARNDYWYYFFHQNWI